jgi:hypothetical protein
MGNLNTVEAFIVGIEDGTTLLKLYLERLRRTPDNGAYQAAVCDHIGEVLRSVQRLRQDLSGVRRADGENDGPLDGLHTVENLEILGEAVNVAALRIADNTLPASDAVLDAMLQATACFVEVAKSLYHAAAPSDRISSSLSRRIVERLRGILSPPDPAGSFHPTGEVFGRITTEFSIGGDEGQDPFDDLTTDIDFFDDVIGGLDEAFDFMEGKAEQPPAESPTAKTSKSVVLDREASAPTAFGLNSFSDELRDLFANIAAGYVQPVKEFVADLRRGNISLDWVEVCRPSVKSIARASESMEFLELSERLTAFDALLAEGPRETETSRRQQEWRGRVLRAYADLESFLPQTFRISDAAASSSEGIIINALLKQIQGVGRGTIRRLFAAGMTSVAAYATASPTDLAAAGVKPALAARICECMRDYKSRQDATRPTPAADDARWLALAKLVEELKRQQFLFKQATLEEWYRRGDSSSRKKECRKERQRVMWQVSVELAELGQEAFLQEIKNLVFDQRISRLERLLRGKTHPD